MTQNIMTEIQRLEAELERLETIHAPRLPTVMVYGAYNHGKSSLLNALIGEEVFSVSDKRETRRAQRHETEHIYWLDTPGLFADTQGEDDLVAQNELDMADHLLLVHRAGGGELDQQELRGFQQQIGETPERCTLLLTAMDDVAPETLDKISQRIAEQLPDVEQLAVSSHRYLKGMRENKRGMIRHSKMAELKAHLDSQLEDAYQQRSAAKDKAVGRINHELEQLLDQCAAESRKIEQECAQREAKLARDLTALQEKYA